MPNVSISCIETRDAAASVRAVERTLRCIRIDAVYWFSDKAFPHVYNDVAVINILVPTFSDFYADTSSICLCLMPRVVTTEFNLIVQADGFAVNPEAWTDMFFEYDYIGAPWPWMWGGGPYWTGPIVGNGGFSLRSRKLYDALLDLRPKWRVQDWHTDPRLQIREYIVWAPDGKVSLTEDLLIALWYRPILESDYGIRFCPPELANRFSVETATHPSVQYWVGKSFGFHGAVAAPYYGVTP